MSKKGYKRDLSSIDEPVNNVDEMAAEETLFDENETASELNKIGSVICKNLNVRKEPTKDSMILKIISQDTVVEILDDSNKIWYKIRIGEIGSGFCMKEFIKVKE